MKIADPECLALSAERIAALLMEAAAEADGGTLAIAIDRLALSEAVTTVALANSHGFRGSYSKSLAFLSVSLTPAEPGAAAVVEERSACRLADLDPRDCLREALQRTRPARRPVEALAGRAAPLLLTPRASASLLAAITHCALSGEAGLFKGSGLRIVDDPTMDGRPGSAPFDGVGYDTRRTVLVQDGAAVGRLSADWGNLIRPSYRDLPAVGAAGLLIAPAESPAGADDGGPAPSSDDTLTLRVAAIEILTGPVCTVRIRRGDWWSGGTSIGPADGLTWEGPLTLLLRGVTAVGAEVKFYHCGAPLGAPGLRIDGLTPLLVEAPGRSAVRF